MHTHLKKERNWRKIFWHFQAVPLPFERVFLKRKTAPKNWFQIWSRLESRKPLRPTGTYKTHMRSLHSITGNCSYFQVNSLPPQNHFNQDCVSPAWNISSICRCKHWLPTRQAQKQSHQKWITTNYSVLCSFPLIGLAWLSSSIWCAAVRDRGSRDPAVYFERGQTSIIFIRIIRLHWNSI